MTTKPKALIARQIFDDVLAFASEHCIVDSNQQDTPLPPEQFAIRLADKVGVMTTVMDRIDAKVLENAPNLKVVSNIAVGYNNIDVPACTARGILVCNTPGVLDDTTADLTWAILMAAARRVAEGDAFVRRGDWKTAFALKAFLGADVHHATLGIIGMGRIGQAIARRARGFDMNVIYHNRTRLPADDESRLAVTYRPSKEDVLADADFVVLMVPYSPATHHLIGAAEIARMKKSAILVNTARGGVVNDRALIAALKAGQIAGAALDVFEGEPALNPEYAGLRNVVLTPHIGSASHATRHGMARLAAENMVAALAGKRPAHVVNPQVL